MKRSLKPRSIAAAMMFVMAYSPLLGQITGTVASAQAVQNTTYSYQYDTAGNLTQVTDPLGRVSNQSFDALNRVRQQLQPPPVLGAARPTVNLTYDGLDQIATVSDPRVLVTSYTIDGLGNGASQLSPDTGTTGRTYDTAGNVLTSADARGNVTTYQYDVLNRRLRENYASGAPSLYEYDGGPGGAIGAIGKLSKMTDESGETVYSYGDKGRLLAKTQTANLGEATLVRTVSYAYDNSGRLASLTYPSGNRVNYGYDVAGRVNRLWLNPADASGGTNTSIATLLLDQITYTPVGSVESWAWGNSALTAPNLYVRTFDLDGRVTSYPLGNTAGATPGLQRTLTYDAAGNITAITHVGDATAASYDQGYGYDALNRLTSFNASSSTQTYAYDASGNRIQISFGGTSYANTVSSTSNRLNSTTGPMPAKTNLYDAAGNLKGDGNIIYTYSDRSRLSSVAIGSVTASYLYNGIGQRVSKTGALVPSGANVYAYDEQGQLLGEYHATGVSQQETVYLGGLPVVVLTPDTVSADGTTQIYFVYADHINTPRVITSAATGGAVWRWDSADPFGVVQPNENPSGQGTFVYNARFSGQLFDKETNTHYNYFRDYDPQTGRYIQSDPIGLRGGINTYGYVGGNPVSLSDPVGLEPQGAIDFIRSIFPEKSYPSSSIPLHPNDVPATDDPCVQKYLKDHYGPTLAGAANFGNMQQYVQENVAEGAHLAEEKIIATKGPGAVGARIVAAVPGSLAVGNRIGAGLIATSTALSGVAEAVGAVFTPFGTTAMATAREACTCKK